MEMKEIIDFQFPHERSQIHYQKVPREIRIDVIGDKSVGKSSFLSTYVSGYFSTTARHKIQSRLMLNGVRYTLHIQERKYEHIFPKHRTSENDHQMDCFVLCYTGSPEAALVSLEENWLKPLSLYYTSVPIVLLETKTDLLRFIPKVRAEIKIEHILDGYRRQIHSWIQCSAKTGQSIEIVFVEVIRIVNKQLQQHGHCICF